MALRFRTRLNLTIASLVFLVVTVMTLVVLFIFAFDLWLQNWNQGTVLTQVTTRNIEHGLIQEGTDPESLQALLDRYMLPELYRGMLIVDANGEILADAGGLNLAANRTLQQRIQETSVSFLEDPPADGFQIDYIGRDIGVLTPLQNENGENAHALYILHNASQQIAFILDRIGVLVTVGFILFMGALIVSIFLSRGLSKPLIELAKGAREFGAGNLNYRLRMRRKDEFNDLAQSFNTMAISIQEYVHELEQETSRRERLESEFRIAAEMQETLLPDAPPDIEGLTLTGWSQPSKEVGGDFFDYIELGEGRVAVVLGDATGKGISAALLSAQCASVLRTLAAQDLTPGELLRLTNNAFYERIGPTHRFVTLFLFVVDTRNATAIYASAGHPPAMLVNPESGKSTWLESTAGYPLGIVENATFTETAIDLAPRDTIVIYSDGLTDAQNHSREMYGEDRVEKSVMNRVGSDCGHLLKDLRLDADEHMNGKEPIDDMTIVIVRFDPFVSANVPPPLPKPINP